MEDNKIFIDAVEDRGSGNNLDEILSGFNMYFLSYNGSREQTRLQVPMSIRKTGLWITYVLYDKTVITEWYSEEAIDDDSWKNLSNWRVGSNMLVGDISISSDGYWVINGVVTTTKAQGEQGITPMLRVGGNNHLQISYTNGSSWADVSTNSVFTQFRVNNNKIEQSLDLGNAWTVVSDSIAAWFRWQANNDNLGRIQISRDNNTWENFSPEFINRMLIKGFVTDLPQSAEYGDIYMVGPYYNLEDSEQVNPYYRMWVMQDTWVDAGDYNKSTYNYSFNYNIKKTYPSVSAMDADKNNPIGTNKLAIKIGDIVTVVNSTTPSENGIYSYEGTTDGWKFQSGFNFQLEQIRSQNPNTAPSSKLFDDEITKIINLGALYKGVATPTTTPGAPDGPVFYITSTQGTYANFGGFVLDGGLAVLSNVTGSWAGTKFLKTEMDAKADHGYGEGETVKTVKDVDDELAQVGADLNVFNTEYEGHRIPGFTNYLLNVSYTDGYFLNDSGTPAAMVGVKYSDYIPVVGKNIYHCYGKQYSYKGCWYDSSHNFIRSLAGDNSTSDKTYIAPSNAAYVRVNVGSNESNVYWVNDSQFANVNKYYIDWLVRNPNSLIKPNEIQDVIPIAVTDKYGGVTVYKENYYLDYSGNEKSSPGIDITDYIPVIGGTVYHKIGVSFAHDGCWYDSSHKFISVITGTNSNPNSSEYSITAPSNAAYVKINVKSTNWGHLYSDSDYNKLGKYYIDWMLPTPENIGATALNATNLLESTTYTDGYFLNDSGTPVAMVGIKYSDYIPVIEGTVYRKSPKQYAFSGCWYDSNHNFISSLAGDESMNDKTYIAPSNAAYVRVNVGSSAVQPYLYLQSDYSKIGKYILPWLYQGETIEPTKTYIGTRDINTYVGAQNHVIDMLVAAKPTAKFIFITHFTEDGAMGNRGLKTLIDAQLKVAQYWGVQCVNLAQLMRATKKDSQTNTLHIFAPDELHPATRHDLWSVNEIANAIASQIKNMFPSWTGKKIAWYGTSIPAGHDLGTEAAQYPKIISTLLGCVVNNYSVSGARIRRGKTDGTLIGISFLDVTQIQNYKTKMLDLIGTANEPDLFVFDFGINDWYQDNKDFLNVSY